MEGFCAGKIRGVYVRETNSCFKSFENNKFHTVEEADRFCARQTINDIPARLGILTNFSVLQKVGRNMDGWVGIKPDTGHSSLKGRPFFISHHKLRKGFVLVFRKHFDVAQK